MEMYLESVRAQSVTIDLLDLQVSFAAGERIHTESSYKYTPLMAHWLFQDSGFHLERTWTDQRGWFALHLAQPAHEHPRFGDEATGASRTAPLRLQAQVPATTR
jgi:hypothetical protein